MKPHKLPKGLIWTTNKLLRKAIKKATFSYYGYTMSDVCINRIISFHNKLKKEQQDD